MANKTIRIKNPDTLAVEATYTTAALDSFYYNTKGNLNIETDSSLVTGTGDSRSGGKINIEPDSDFQVKPGDDFIIYSHHRPGWTGDPDAITEVSMKILDGSTAAGNDMPVNLQLNAANMTFTTKDKDLTKAASYTKNGTATAYLGTQDTKDIFNMSFKTGVKAENADKNNPDMAYLKLRARAIDLRCEGTGGGIAIQPKGNDSDGNENKIKFEHGGGDGLEWFTSNTQKHSVFTDEYRFNKDGVLKMATRDKVDSDKKDSSNPTTYYKYKKNSTANQKDGYESADDFYDFIKTDDPQCTWKDVIKVSNALSATPGVHTKITSDGNLEIGGKTAFYYRGKSVSDLSEYAEIATVVIDSSESYYNLSDVSECVDDLKDVSSCFENFIETWSITKSGKYSAQITTNTNPSVSTVGHIYFDYYTSPQIHIQSESDVELESADDDVKLTAGDAIKMEAPEIKMEAGDDGVNFGTTKTLTFLSKKFTKGCNVETADDVTFKMGILNNYGKTIYMDSDGIFHVAVDNLYTDESCTTLLTTSTAVAGKSLWISDGNPVENNSKYWTIVTNDDSTKSVYLIETKGSNPQIKNNGATVIATISSDGATYTRTIKDETTSEYYYPETVFELSSYSGNELTSIEAGETIPTSDGSFTLSEMASLISYAKSQGWIS